MMKALTVSMQHYIRTVYGLPSNDGGGGVRVSDIAEKMGVTKASASLAMSRLEKEKLVCKDGRRQVYLTPAGKQYAVLMLDKCMVIREFLTNVLSVDKETAAIDACAIEHVISMDTLCALCRFSSRTNAKRQCRESCHVSIQGSFSR